jgi:hypothetical protein
MKYTLGVVLLLFTADYATSAPSRYPQCKHKLQRKAW